MRSLVSGNGGKETVRMLRWVHRLSPTSFKRTRASRLAEMFLKEIRRAVSFTRVQSVTLVPGDFFLFPSSSLFFEGCWTSSFSPSVEIIYYFVENYIVSLLVKGYFIKHFIMYDSKLVSSSLYRREV